MSLQPGDILADDVSEWRVIGHPYSTAGGKIVDMRIRACSKAV
jgi:hypothetical protein